MNKFIKYKTKSENLIEHIQYGGVLTKIEIQIVRETNFNKISKKYDDTDNISIFLNKGFYFMKFQIDKYNAQCVKKYLEDTNIEKEQNDKIKNISEEFLNEKYGIVYYLSNFYTFNENDNPSVQHKKIISEINQLPIETKIKKYEDEKIIHNDNESLINLLLSDTKGIATIILKLVINYYLQRSHSNGIIFCCEPILGTRDNSISYKNYLMTPEERYHALIKYYELIGLTNSIDVFMILGLYIKNYIYSNASDEDINTDLKIRREKNSRPVKPQFSEDRKFMIGLIDRQFSNSDIRMPNCNIIISFNVNETYTINKSL